MYETQQRYLSSKTAIALTAVLCIVLVTPANNQTHTAAVAAYISATFTATRTAPDGRVGRLRWQSARATRRATHGSPRRCRVRSSAEGGRRA